MNAPASFAELLAAFLEARDHDRHVDPAEWTQRHPEHADALRAYLQSEGWLNALASDFQLATATRPGPQRVITPPVIEGYTIHREMARGGMGVVFEAEQHEPKRRVALKTLRDAVLATDDDVRRFRREAQAVADLEHPGIVRILALGETEGRIWFTMPLASGGNLRHRMAEWVGNPDRAARCVRDIARAVAHGHARGILHRDLKPSNILLDAQGNPIVADFGLARRMEGHDGDRTQTGTVMGTPAYMAPEQARGDVRAIDERTDVWSLGAILYQLLSGRPPFLAASPAETLEQVLAARPRPLGSVAPGVPKPLTVICATCLRAALGDRYGSMRDLADDLDRYLDGRPIQARRPGFIQRSRLWIRRRPAAAALGLVSIAAIVALTLALLFARQSENEERRRRAGDLLALAQRLSEEGDIVGAQLHFAAADHLYPTWTTQRGLLAHETPIALRIEPTPSGTLWRVRHDPAGMRTAAGGADGRVHLWNATSVLATLAHGGHAVRGLAFDASGGRLATGSDNGIVRVWNLAERRVTAELKLPVQGNAPTIPAIVWLDEQTVAAGCSNGVLYTWAFTGGQLHSHRLAQAGVQITALAVDPTGATLLVGMGHGAAPAQAVLVSARSGRALGPSAEHTTAVWDCAWHPDGTRFATADDGFAAIWSASDFRLLHKFAHDTSVGALAFSPDGTQLVTATTAGLARVFDATSGREIGRPRRHTSAIYGVAVHPVSNAISCVGLQGTLYTWPKATGPAHWQVLPEGAGPGTRAVPARQGGAILVHGTGGDTYGRGLLRLWSPGLLGDAHITTPFPADPSRDEVLSVTASGERAFMLLVHVPKEARDTGELRLVGLSVEAGRMVLDRGAPVRVTGPPSVRSILPGQHCVLLQLGETLGVYPYDDTLALRTGRQMPNTLAWAVSESGRWIARQHFDDPRRFTVETTETGAGATTVLSGAEVARVAIADNGHLLALVLRDEITVVLHDMRTGKRVTTIRQRHVWDIHFSGGGRNLLTTDRSGIIRAWNTETGAAVGRTLDPKAAGFPSTQVRIRLAAHGGTTLGIHGEGQVVRWDTRWMTQTESPSGWARRRRRAELAAMRRIHEDGTMGKLDLATWRAWRRQYDAGAGSGR